MMLFIFENMKPVLFKKKKKRLWLMIELNRMYIETVSLLFANNTIR